jgi:hypothetical protein
MAQLQSHIWLTASSYLWGNNCAFPHTYIRKPFLIYGFATAPLWISLYMRKIRISFFYQCVIVWEEAIYCSMSSAHIINSGECTGEFINLAMRTAAGLTVNWDGILGHIWEKTRVFCSMLFAVFLLADFSRKTRLYSGFKNTSKKNCRTRNII